ncbi:MAG TPA: hypothetical protein VKV05_11665 [Terriglobales bacterium]|nr:hypothetical protein [Terriglobales bacterium]
MKFLLLRNDLSLRSHWLAAACCLLLLAPPVVFARTTKLSAHGVNPAVQAEPPYSVSLFTQGVPGEYSAPDSITFNTSNIYIGWGNNGDPEGGNSIPSTIIEYDFNGNIINQVNIIGHNDGLKINPQSGDLWATVNEDGNSRLYIMDPQTLAMKHSYFLGTGPHGGGYDDIVFLNGNVYLACSNPTHNPNNEPAIVQFTASGNNFTLTPVLYGNAFATDIPTGQQVQLNLQDPDSMTYNIAGEIVLDSQADGELVVVRNPGAGQSVYRVLLSVNGGAITVDDTDFLTDSAGVLLVADTAGDAVYEITAPFLEPGSAYSASDTGGFVGTLDFETGVLTPVVTGMVSPHGMMFIPQH